MDKNIVKNQLPNKVTAEQKTAMTTIATKIIELIRTKHT